MPRSYKSERRRYIGFSVEMVDGVPPDRGEMVIALDDAASAAGLAQRRRLTVFTGSLGIARCGHDERDALVGALNSIDEVAGRPATVGTLVTSGTIKKVKAHLRLTAEE
jgi:RNase P/RNase MRP subunit POP5